MTERQAAESRDLIACDLSSAVASGANEDNVSGPLASGFEWKSRAVLFGIPLICIAFGRDGRGRLRVAKGFLAVGQCAFGGIVIAQFGAGIVAVGQFVLGLFAFGQLALAVVLAVGQIAGGLLAIGQVVVGLYGLGQIGWADYLWSSGRTDMEAVATFSQIKMTLLGQGGWSAGAALRRALENMVGHKIWTTH
ncbi:MAG: hypothetical protein WBG50_21440 [Desulfomonilaceae bacterium]